MRPLSSSWKISIPTQSPSPMLVAVKHDESAIGRAVPKDWIRSRVCAALVSPDVETSPEQHEVPSVRLTGGNAGTCCSERWRSDQYGICQRIGKYVLSSALYLQDSLRAIRSDLTTSPYSMRNDTIGSRCVARRAGKYEASAATAAKAIATAANVQPSSGVIP